MFENRTEYQARKDILTLVEEYANKFHRKREFKDGQHIPYASRVYDSAEMIRLVDSVLEFWLTSGRYTDEFENRLAEYLNVKYCSLVNSGSSANLIAFFSIIIAIFYLTAKIFFGNIFYAGTAPILIEMFFLGAIQLIFLGLLGEYILSINQRVMKRPLVIEEERINF